MASKDNSANEPFDLGKVRQLIEMMEKHDLAEVHLKRGEEQWRLKRGAQQLVMAPAIPVPQAAAPAAPAAVAPATSGAPTPAPATETGLVIKSPTVGTFYAAQTPEEPPFVQVGTVVSPTTVVCLIEAMKVFNQIPAELSGTITAVLVKNGDPVEFGQPLFRVKP